MADEKKSGRHVYVRLGQLGPRLAGRPQVLGTACTVRARVWSIVASVTIEFSRHMLTPKKT